jgi:hypothetical protein
VAKSRGMGGKVEMDEWLSGYLVERPQATAALWF